MTTDAHPHPERYDDFDVGDRVFCLAWIGREFEIVGKHDEGQRIELQGLGPSSLPEGAQVDLTEASLFMLTHNLWDTIWHWPDRAGETYQQVWARFLADHEDGELVTGYATNAMVLPEQPDPDAALTFRVSFAALDAWNQVYVQPLAAVAEDGKELVRAYDPSIPFDRWIQCAPVSTVTLGMHAYRWAISYGSVLLNWRDFVG